MINRPAFIAVMLVSLVAAVAAAPVAAQAPDTLLAQSQSGLPLEGLYRFIVNGQAADRSIVVLEEGGRLYVAADALRRLGITRLDGPAIERGGERLYRLDTLAGVAVQVDRARLQVVLQVDPERLAGAAWNLEQRPRVQPQLPPPGVYLNYDLVATSQEGASDSLAAGFELAAFGPLGFANTSAARRADGSNALVRLDSAWRRDDPDLGLTLQLGDSISRAPVWGRAVRFAGVSWGSNPSLRPWLVTTPLLAVNGSSAVPTTLDVFVNQQLIESRPVPPGPFSVTGIPTVTGGGTVSVVARDALGREQVLSQSFYTGRTLLREGYAEYGVDAGSVRENYGLRSADYGNPTLALNWRGGITNAWTVGGHLHALQGVALAGGDSSVGLGNMGLLTATVAASDADAGQGWLTGLAFERSDPARALSLLVDVSTASGDFRLPGDREGTSTPRRQLLATVGTQPFRRASIAVSYLRRELINPLLRPNAAPVGEVETIAATASMLLAASVSLVATWTESRRPVRSDSIFLSLIVPLERPRGSASVGANKSSGGDWVGNAAFQSQYPLGPGVGVRGYAQTDGLVQLGALWNTNVTTATAELARSAGGDTGLRLGMAGAFGWTADATFASRPIIDSFAILDVGDAPNVRVYRENTLAATTDARGRAIVPTLAAYSDNRLRLEPRDVPLDVRLGDTAVVLAPFYRSPARHDFGARREQAASFIAVRRVEGKGKGEGEQAVLPAGTALVAGALQLVVGHDGVVYIPNLTEPLVLRATVQGKPCKIAVPAPAPAPAVRRDLLDLGTLVCEEGT